MKILRSTRYFWPFIFAALLVLAEGYALSMSEWFVKYSLADLPLVQVSEIKFTSETEHIDAEIVFVGDSTSLFDIVPAVVERETGLKTYNLGIPIDAFAYGGDSLLSHYLQHNHPPKYIVLHINPWTQITDYDTTWLGSRDGDGTQWEGIWVTVRHGSWRDIAAIFAREPANMVKLPLGALRLTGKALMDHFGTGFSGYEQTRGALAAYAGFLPLKATAYNDSCHSEKFEVQPDSVFIESFRKRYTTSETKALIFIAPIPECDKSLESLQQAYSALADLHPRTMPNSYFLAQAHRSHTVVSGAIANSQTAGSFIRKMRGRWGE